MEMNPRGRGAAEDKGRGEEGEGAGQEGGGRGE